MLVRKMLVLLCLKPVLERKGIDCQLPPDVIMCSPGNSVLHKDREMAETSMKEI